MNPTPPLPLPLGVFGLVGARPFELLAHELEPLKGAVPPRLRPMVARYLREGSVVLPVMEYTEDVVGGAFGVSGGSGVLSDGTYYWRRDAAEYVAHYGIDVGTAAVEHMRAQAWTPPELNAVELESLDDQIYQSLRSRNKGGAG